MLRVGDVVDRYRVLSQLGEGGMGTVYKVAHSLLGSTHALKVLNADLFSNHEARERFITEGQLQAKLRHPNLIPVTEVVSTDQLTGLVMDYVEGGSLAAVLARASGPLPTPYIDQVFAQLLDAMAFVHRQGVVHRDLKPDNILVRADPAGPHPFVTDFGIAKASLSGLARQRSTLAGARLGTLSYMSPEQVHDAKDVTAASDIFSLGVILYEMVTGRHPFEVQSPFQTQKNIVEGTYPPPEALAPQAPTRHLAALARALRVVPEERFSSCEEFQAALQIPLGTAASARPGSPTSGLEASLAPGAAPPLEPDPPPSPTSLPPRRQTVVEPMAARPPWAAPPPIAAPAPAESLPKPALILASAEPAPASLPPRPPSDGGLAPMPSAPRRQAWGAAVGVGAVGLGLLVWSAQETKPAERPRAAQSQAQVSQEPLQAAPQLLPSNLAPAAAPRPAPANVPTALSVPRATHPSPRPAPEPRAATAPSAAPQPPGSVRVVVLLGGEASTADIAIDGQPQGAAPLITALPPGRHEVQLRRKDFLEEKKTVEVASGQDQLLRFELHPAALGKGTLRLITKLGAEPAWANWKLDGRPAEEKTPAEVQVEAGRHTVEVWREGGPHLQREIQVPAGERTVLTLELAP